MRRGTITTVHVALSLILLVAAFCGRWIWAGLSAEYGHGRGPNGEYIYDLSEPATIAQVNLTGITIGIGLAAAYWLAVLLVRKAKS